MRDSREAEVASAVGGVGGVRFCGVWVMVFL